MTASPGRRLRDALAAHHPLVLPGLQDALSARLVQRAGFEVGYLSGSAVAMTLLGLPDIGLLSGTELIDQARRIAAASDLAIVCDADTGFGNAVNVAYTVRALEAAGMAGVQLEDQTFPKRCGHFAGKSVIETSEMLEKVHAAVEARRDDDFVIVGRTDARAVIDLEEAIDRGRAYAAAGADVIFVEAPQTVDELELVAGSIDAPTLVNVVEGGKTPQLSLGDYAEMGFSVVLYPTAAVRTAARALENLYGHLRAHGSTEGAPVEMISFAERNEINDFDAYERIGDRAVAAAQSATHHT
ncbi:MAG TPA: oxaloacetate decarboxylase [Solirubrobacteraceae bacterium]|nr:oxaloacetate decarboxylase [Solirubrobacteraceae bacterium]